MPQRQVDRDKKEEQLNKQMKFVDPLTGKVEDKANLIKLRSAIRQVWMRHPTKLTLIMRSAVLVQDVPVEDRPKNLSKAAKWLYQCTITKTWHLLKDMECDHIKGENSLRCYGDLESFSKSILDVGWEDLQLLSKEAHEILTYAERWGLTFEQARGEKEVIAVAKLTAPRQRKWLTARKIKPASNKDGRVVQIREYLNKNRG